MEAGDALPPLSFLQAALKSSGLDITPEKALQVLRDHHERQKRPSLGWERKLCNGKSKLLLLKFKFLTDPDHGIKTSHLAILAMVLNRSPTPATRQLGKRLLLSASALGEKFATLHIVKGALAQSALSSPEIAAPLQRLTLLAQQGQDPDAMLLYAQVQQERGSDGEALRWAREASERGGGFGGLSGALTLQGVVLLKRKDEVAAARVLGRAALELDDPGAYFLLAGLQREGSVERETYMLKAAMSGIAGAAHSLGVMELSKLKKRAGDGLSPSTLGKGVNATVDFKEFRMAIEWLEVAAASGFGLSMLDLAKIYKSSGQDKEGRKWLEMAEGLPGLRRECRSMRDNWEKIEKLSSYSN